jgi:hypothetical protein
MGTSQKNKKLSTIFSLPETGGKNSFDFFNKFMGHKNFF